YIPIQIKQEINMLIFAYQFVKVHQASSLLEKFNFNFLAWDDFITQPAYATACDASSSSIANISLQSIIFSSTAIRLLRTEDGNDKESNLTNSLKVIKSYFPKLSR